MAEIRRHPCDDPQCICHINYADQLASSNPGADMKEAMEQVRRDPDSAIRSAGSAQAPPENPFLQALVKLAVIEPRVRQSGALSLFIRLVVDGSTSDTHIQPDGSINNQLHWETPLAGIINVMAGVSNDGSMTRDSEILQEIREAWPSVSKTLLKDLDFLWQPNSGTDSRRASVALIMLNLIDIAGMRE